MATKQRLTYSSSIERLCSLLPSDVPAAAEPSLKQGGWNDLVCSTNSVKSGPEQCTFVLHICGTNQQYNMCSLWACAPSGRKDDLISGRLLCCFIRYWQQRQGSKVDVHNHPTSSPVLEYITIGIPCKVTMQAKNIHESQLLTDPVQPGLFCKQPRY